MEEVPSVSSIIDEEFSQNDSSQDSCVSSPHKLSNPRLDGWIEKLTTDSLEEGSQTSDFFSSSQANKVKQVELYGEEKGPRFYTIKSNHVTRPIIAKNLPEAFSFLNLEGRPKSKADLSDMLNNKVKEFVGFNLSDEEFSKLEEYCSPENLKTGKEVTVKINPDLEPGCSLDTDFNTSCLDVELIGGENAKDTEDGYKLTILEKLALRKNKDVNRVYRNKLKYRGLRLKPLVQEGDYSNMVTLGQTPLQPGKDLVYHVRIYRPFYYLGILKKGGSRRHGVLMCDAVLLGRHKLSVLRDRFVCPNDVSDRIDQSENPYVESFTPAKDLFPSGFLFINNVFYVDRRPGCKDLSAVIRQWAKDRGLGIFPVRDMDEVTFQELELKLGHPEVYVHQGNCEHPFTFSSIRLLNPTDPLILSQYPTHTLMTSHHVVYCTTCAEFGAKWIVEGSKRIPFDPSFFCDTCFKLYMYKDGKKVGDFRAYKYRCNEINEFKPGVTDNVF